MEQCYIVDAARMPWKRSSIGGLTFKGQVLLSGHDGGPEALRFSFDDCPSMYAHMHLTSQFQLLLHGAMDFPRGVKHPKAGGIISMGNLDARRQINLRGRIFASLSSQAEWRPLPDLEQAQFKFLM